MTAVSERMDAALDDAVERLLAVALRWAEDKKGPSASWVHSLARTVAVLVDARVALAKGGHQ